MTTCKVIQQNFYENLGNREYDCFQASEEKYLKLKIGYTLFGAPQNDDKFNNLDGDYTAAQVYDENKNKLISNIHSVIKSRSVNNEDRDQVIVSFMFNCCQFLKRKKNETDENMGCFPIFRVRKCTGSPTNKNCCVYIDEHSRVYQSWEDYLKNNKIPKAKMFVPKDGKYQGNENDQVELEEILSPACDLKEDIIKVADYSSTAASLISGGISIGAMIPAITVSPMLVAGAMVTGAGVGAYSIFRSSLVLHDRKKHSQSISLKNNEARNSYLNMVAGATSVVTTGATRVATNIWSKGATIGEGAATALLSVNAANIAVNSCNVANSIYKFVDDYKNNKKISSFDIMQFSANVLFFGNAVITFKIAKTIYNETQTSTFGDMVRSNSQSLWTRAKNTFYRSDMTSTDNNSSVKVIENSGDFCSNAVTLTLREKGRAACNSTYNLLSNFIQNIDLESALRFSFLIIENKDNAFALCTIILSRFEYQIQDALVNITKYLIGDVIQDCNDILNQIFPKSEKVVILLNFVINYMKFKVTGMEINYYGKKSETVRELNISNEEYDNSVGGFNSTAERMTYFLKTTVLSMVHSNGQPQEVICREMIHYFWGWLNEKVVEHTLKISQSQVDRQIVSERKTVDCSKCGGYFFIF